MPERKRYSHIDYFKFIKNFVAFSYEAPFYPTNDTH